LATQTLERPKPSRSLTSFIHILSWLPNYNRAWLVADILAGLTLWGQGVPEGMVVLLLGLVIATVFFSVTKLSTELPAYLASGSAQAS